MSQPPGDLPGLRGGHFQREEAHSLDLALRRLLASVTDNPDAPARGLTLSAGFSAPIRERR